VGGLNDYEDLQKLRVIPDISEVQPSGFSGMHKPAHSKIDMNYSAKTLKPTYIAPERVEGNSTTPWIKDHYHKVIHRGRTLWLSQASKDVLWDAVMSAMLDEGREFYDKGDYGEALEFCILVRKINPDIVEEWFLRGEILVKLERNEKGAIESFQKVLKQSEDPFYREKAREYLQILRKD
jgi:tetratricopeptide (TPR) repeat protein